MNEIKGGGPAFPCDEQIRDSMIYQPEPGMTLRDYFAAKAMGGWLASYAGNAEHPANENAPQKWADSIAEASYRLADAMLRAREEK